MVMVVTEAELRRCVDIDHDALNAIEAGFAELGRGRVTIPPIMGLEIPERNGAADVKAAYVDGWDSFAIKLSTRFFDNPARGLPSAGGLMTLLDSGTGQVLAVLLDNGYLTTVRTALAGALAAKYLAPAAPRTVAVIGAGSQAQWQVRALRLVREFERVLVYSRSGERAEHYAEEMPAELGVPVETVDSAEAAVRAADLVVTTTPASQPLVRGEWLRPGTHVTAMGSDAAHKNELEPELLRRADVLACDLKSQSASRGELHHALDAGVLPARAPVRELAAIVRGDEPGRERDDQITVCDLTGVGVQDTAIARWALRRMAKAGLGREL